ncbi:MULTISPECIES: photosystem II biogenesis protein Psp29 [Leptolyngbya]|uniref:Protein Thf1 n=1 Tax=Leptolyngbya boryana CZ1 TaxID=3060204 RepID=A0AA97AVS8_LEPBY|nr:MULTISPECIES: photosystem II biogenesis protein Psp29 [Leptolyngbya]MBD1858467.1 photosystem II biogenesis protein Psp29 [Leptolyngbya sp. FACHB-1624]MBN8560397.1 photosystem II biogenesis protein Psp29 [Leptolyngbya sp. UWPOB_LEPTO1]MCY6489761.1 photosystem II biogenesis protein Psp29 [Leptolyngbya sp. GGD]WNZ47665.1 photosystem II biogenesis protein Psp29 [Leptolyngbya boryana CZ1]
MNSVRTVSDTKRSFYSLHTRPVNSIFRRVVEELMVEMHLLAVNTDFRYDPFYALGVVTTFDRFMQGYRPEADKESIFTALCKALEADPQQYRTDAQRLVSTASSAAWDSMLIPDKAYDYREALQAVASNPKFKYSRLFAVGLYTILEASSPDVVKDTAKLNETFKQICQALNISEEKVQKDLELYRSNLEKMNQMQVVIAEALAADRKKREEREQAQAKPKDEATSES